MDATELLEQDHLRIEDLFRECEVSEKPSKRQAAFERIQKALVIHASLEEQVFYPALESLSFEVSTIAEARRELGAVEQLLSHISSKEVSQDSPVPDPPEFERAMNELRTEVERHVQREEKTLFPQARKALSQTFLATLREKMETLEKSMDGGPRFGAPDSGFMPVRKGPAMTEQEHSVEEPAPILKEAAQEVTQAAKEKVEQAASGARKEVPSTLDRQKIHAVEELEGLADSLQKAASGLPEGDDSGVGFCLTHAARGAGDLSHYLKEKSSRVLIDEAVDFARHHPVLVAAGGILVGALLGRLLGVTRHPAVLGEASRAG